MRRRRVLIVEDTLLVVTLLEEVFSSLEFDIVGPAGTLEEALRLAQTAVFDIAVLDINLHDELVFPVADVLVERAIPYFFSSGNSATLVLPARFAGTPLLAKPYEIGALIEVITQTVARSGQAPVGTKVNGN